MKGKIMAKSIGEILNDRIQVVLSSPDLEGLQIPIVNFMRSFTKPEGISQLVLYLDKVDIDARFELMNQIMRSRMPEDFPVDNIKLWHALMSMIHSVLAVITKSAVLDERMAEAMKEYSEDKDPYVMEAN